MKNTIIHLNRHDTEILNVILEGKEKLENAPELLQDLCLGITYGVLEERIFKNKSANVCVKNKHVVKSIGPERMVLNL